MLKDISALYGSNLLKRGAKVHDADLEAKFAALNRSLAMIEFTPDGKITSANDNFLQAMGYGLEEIVGKHHRIFCHSNFVNSRAYEEHWRQLAAGLHFTGTIERVTSSGSSIWLEASYHPVLDRSGQVRKVIKLASDITEKTTEQHLQKCTIDALHQSMAVIEFELDGTIITANENFLAVTGYHLSEIVGEHHKIFCHKELVESSDYREFWVPPGFRSHGLSRG